MAAATSSSSSGSCSSLFSFRSAGSAEPKSTRGSSSHGHGSPGCVAMWFINGVASAFFASLDRCSCIRVATTEDDGDQENDVPLIHNDGNVTLRNPTDHAAISNTRRRTGKGKNK